MICLHTCIIANENIDADIVYRNNVLFQKLNTVSMSHSQWIFSFVIDLSPIESALQITNKNILTLKDSVNGHIRKYTGLDQYHYKRSFMRLLKDITHLETDVKQINAELDKIASLHVTKMDRQNFEKLPLSTRNRRSLLPFVGSISKFLFGTSTEKDLNKVKSALRKLAKEQNDIRHVIRENLSILNVTRNELKTNRHAINGLITSLQHTNAEIYNITTLFQRRMSNFKHFVIKYMYTSLILQENRETVQRAYSYINTLNQQLNAIASGTLPQSIIHPTQLQSILTLVQRQLPSNLRLPEDPLSNTWYYYKNLKSALVVRKKQFLILTSLQLNDIKSQFDIYSIINTPLGLANTSLSAFYKLSHNYIAVSIDRSKYILLTYKDAGICTRSNLKLCAPDLPIYSFFNTRNCIASLFINKLFSQNCETAIRSDIELPTAYYLSKGNWIISLIEPFTMNIICGNTNRKQLLLKPFFKIISLASGCYAYSDRLNLPSYFMRTSQNKVDNVFAKLINPYNQSEEPILWKPLETYKIDPIKIPKQLDNIQEISMKSLINKLKSTENIEKTLGEDNDSWEWKDIILYIITGTVFSIILYLIFSKLLFKYFGNKCLQAMCVNRSPESNIPALPSASKEENKTITSENKATTPPIMQQVADIHIQTEEYPAESGSFIKATCYKSTDTQTDSLTVEDSITKVHQLTY